MKVELYNHIVERQKLSRRKMLQGAASVGAMAAVGGFATGASLRPAFAAAHENLRAEILKIPGVGMGSPTDADWQKVGDLCLGPTKERVAEGEFAGVELTCFTQQFAEDVVADGARRANLATALTGRAGLAENVRQ